MKPENLFTNIPHELPEEIFEDLVKNDHVRIERIVSKGQSSPEKGWYDQKENEWVLVVKGKAKLRFEKDNELIELTEGMHINIPAHQKHKVEWTDPNQETIWIAVFY